MKVEYWYGGRKSKPCFEALSLKELNMLKSVLDQVCECTPGCNMLGSNLATYHDSIFTVDFHCSTKCFVKRFIHQVWWNKCSCI